MSILIKGVNIISSGQSSEGKKDVLVSKNKISAIGEFPNKIAEIVLDGRGIYLSAGFIDINTDSDHYLTLFSEPNQGDFLKQGVTTILGGLCGASLAPLIYGSLESIQKWVDVSKINTNWHLLAEFLDYIEAQSLGVNFGTLVGHSTIRRSIVGESLRQLTANELDVFNHILLKIFDLP